VNEPRRIAIVQPNYIPWKGYFDLIASCSLFVLYDDVQFTKNDWRNRNLIKTPTGLQWLTVPVGQRISRLVKDVEIIDCKWQKKHWHSLVANYRRAKFAEEIFSLLEPLYLKSHYANLVSLNRAFINVICGYLDIRTEIVLSSAFPARQQGSDGVLALCRNLNASVYVSGPAAKSYLRTADFEASGIQVEWFDYSGYPEYPQLWGSFTHEVTILDLLFNCGPLSRERMKAPLRCGV
jgi:hypothetical protein